MDATEERMARRRRAYAELAGALEAGLLRTARRLSGGREDPAQDLVQEALIRGYQAYVEGRFAEGTNARAWLMRILMNVFLNDYRSARRKAEVPLGPRGALEDEAEADPDAVPAPDDERPEAVLMAATLDEPLMRALAGLSRELRAAVILVDVEGLEYAEAAAALGVPIGTVRSRLSRARLQLHEALFDYARERRRAYG